MDTFSFVFVLYILFDVVSSNDVIEEIFNTLKHTEVALNQLKSEIYNLKEESEKKDISIQTLITTDLENKARIEMLEESVAILSEQLNKASDKTHVDTNLETLNLKNNSIGEELTERFDAPESTQNKRSK